MHVGDERVVQVHAEDETRQISLSHVPMLSNPGHPKSQPVVSVNDGASKNSKPVPAKKDWLSKTPTRLWIRWPDAQHKRGSNALLRRTAALGAPATHCNRPLKQSIYPSEDFSFQAE